MKKILLFLLFTTIAQAQIVTFTDANFKARLLSASPSNYIASTQTPDIDGYVTTYNTIDTNGDGEIQVSESLLIKYLSVSSSNISNLSGINSFTNLQSLGCIGNQLTNLNINSLTNLKFLFCGNNLLSNITFNSLTNLQDLKCSNNQLINLNLTNFINLQTLECGSNQLTNLNISGLTNLHYLDCSNNQLPNLDVSSFTNLMYFICSNNNRTSLNVSSLTNLKSLFCDHNSLSNINVSNLSNLIGLNCSYNQLASLNVSGLTNLLVLDSSYNLLTNIGISGLNGLTNLVCSHNQLTSFNASNLTNLGYFRCENNQLTNLNINGLMHLGTLNCDSNQLQSINVNSLTNLSELHCAHNQLPNLDVSSLTNLQGLDCSYNQLPNLDVSGTNMISLICSNNQISVLDLSSFSQFGYLDSANNQLVTINIKNNNSNPWYGLIFDNNPNLTYVCSDDGDIDYVQQKIDQSGYTNTCHVNSYCNFTPGGTFYTIQGNNKVDANNNGCDINDLVYPNLKFNITDGTISGSLISNNSGNYSIPVQAGTHTITPQLENTTYFNTSPTSTSVTFPATASPAIRNFCITPNGVHHDLEIVVIPLNTARPGFDATYKIKYRNKGTDSENATINFNFNDAILDYVSSTVATTTQSTGIISWNLGTVTPFESGEIVVTLNLNSPSETPPVNAGDLFSYTATINGLNTDETPDDNTFTLPQMVFNAFDPNDKTCLEGTAINPTMIGKYVHYKIRFENTGTFPAQNIVVKDMIDTTKFDISSLQMTDASHSCVTKITNPDKVEFIFENINLPIDDANNDGYVVFKIKTKPTLVVGNSISNLANIYFDYNFPIVTNTATSTFQTLANDNFNLESKISLSPIPSKDILTISIQDSVKINSVSIYNVLGQVVQTIIGSSNTINVSELKTGDYFIKITTESGTISKKFIKE